MTDNSGSFWEHLEELRGVLLRLLAAVVTLSIVAFILKEPLFRLVLAPSKGDFPLFQLLDAAPFELYLMNTGLTEQFLIHVKTAMYAGLLVASPYIIYALFGFIAPALYENERKNTTQVVCFSYIMFILGTAINYIIVFPLTVRFLGTYQVSPDVANMLTLQSYVDTLLMMSLLMGIVFELPVVCWLLARMGILKSALMREYRRHALVAILTVSAIITPTTDAFTFLVVALPIWLLYECSILIVKTVKQKG